jgi:glycerol kinase
MSHLIAIDQGTTSTRAIVFDAALAPIAVAQQELRQIYPAPGLVEHDPEDIWSAVVATVRDAMAKAGVAAKDIAGIGITNQRETTIVWDRVNGKPIHNAIVWQDRRTAEACAVLRAAGHEPAVTAKTGLVLDPYFSATKIGWLLDHVNRARPVAEQSRLAFGTVDSFLLWRLTGGKVTPPTPPMRRARCCSISAAAHGIRTCWICSPSRAACCPRCATALPISAKRGPICSVARSASAEWPGTSRRRPSGRAASPPAC